MSEPKEIQWETVAQTAGLEGALVIAGRLHAEEIPARAWQEGAGQALGLVVGILGTGHVAVPVEFVDQALDILHGDEDEYEYEEEE